MSNNDEVLTIDETDVTEVKPNTEFRSRHMNAWLSQLKTLHPHIPDNLLLHILKTYDEKPHILDAIVEEDKKCPIKPKSRPEIQGVYNNVEIVKENE